MTDLADLIENYMLQGKQYDKENADKLYGGWKLLINQWKWWGKKMIIYDNSWFDQFYSFFRSHSVDRFWGVTTFLEHGVFDGQGFSSK